MLYLKTETRAWLLRTSFCFVIPSVWRLELRMISRTCRSNKLCSILWGQTVELAWRVSRSSLPRMRPPGCRLLADRPEAEPTGSDACSRADRDNLPSMRLDSRQACSRRSDTVIWNCATVLSLPFRIRGAIESDSRGFYMRPLLIINTLSMLELIPRYS